VLKCTHVLVVDIKNCLYVCLRKYRGLKSSGFGVVEKAVSYQAFQLTVTFRHISDTPDSKKYLDTNGGMFLVVVATPVYSSYKGNLRIESRLELTVFSSS
jgi:period circadian protein